MTRWVDVLQTRAEGWTILVRLMVGLIVFFPEGIQKLVSPEILGAGRSPILASVPRADGSVRRKSSRARAVCSSFSAF
jgi:hypothetical protein